MSFYLHPYGWTYSAHLDKTKNMKFPFKILSKRSLGIDIGTTAIRMVELSGRKERTKLENYGEVKTLIFPKKPFRIFERSALFLPTKRTGQSLKGLLKEAGIKTRQASFSIPDFSSFFTAVDFPPMKRKELGEAVEYEARRHVPLPLSEVVLDWQLIDQKTPPEKGRRARILLVVVPKEVIEQYKAVSEIAQLGVSSLEAEVFSLMRALKDDLWELTALIEMGAQSTTVSIIEGEELKSTHSFDLSGNELTQTLAESLEIDYEKAEVLKKVKGIRADSIVREVLTPLVDLVLTETNRILREFVREEGKGPQKLILAGGTALLPGLKDYFTQKLKKEVLIADPFKGISCPEILKDSLGEIAPSFAIAVGVAKRGISK